MVFDNNTDAPRSRSRHQEYHDVGRHRNTFQAHGQHVINDQNNNQDNPNNEEYRQEPSHESKLQSFASERDLRGLILSNCLPVLDVRENDSFANITFQCRHKSKESSSKH